MTREKPDNTQWPTPLLERKGRLGQLVREYVQDTEARSDDTAFQRLMVRAARPASRGRQYMPIVAAGLAATCVVGAAALGLGDRASPSVPVTPPSAASHAAPSNATPSARALAHAAPLPVVPPADLAPPAPPQPPALVAVQLRLRQQRTSLPVGRVELAGEAVAILSADGKASGRTIAKHTEIVLDRGDLELQVLPRAPAHDFSVRVGRYRFTVVGTVFTVSQSRSRLELMVRKGKVAVSREGEPLAMVAAGETWAAELRVAPAPAAAVPALPSPAATGPADTGPAPPELPSPAPSAGRVSPPQSLADCRQLVTGRRTSEALLCYQAQSARGGLGGETAQYELARLWRDALGDRARALAAFEDQRSRFPGGALRIEADLSIIELLPRLGRHAEAIAETERFLTAHPKAERGGELRLLRGNIYREVLRDLAHAEQEYAQGADSGGRAGDDCRFLHAVCLEALGRVAEAREAYQAYLLGRKAAHTQEVKVRLERLRP